MTAHTHDAHTHDVRPFLQDHTFTDAGAAKRASALTAVTVITFVTMIIELVAGYWSGSLALTADGWHMGTHAVALGGAALAYRLSQKANTHDAYAFGGWKIEVLSGYSSGLLLMAVAIWLVFDSVRSLIFPEAVNYQDALVVAVIGLLVNLASAWLLSRGGDHGHGHRHSHGHSHGKVMGGEAGRVHDHGDHDHAHDGHAHGHDVVGSRVGSGSGVNAQAHGHAHSHDGHDHDHSTVGAPSRASSTASSTASSSATTSAAAGAVPKAAHDHNFNAAYIHVLADLFTSVLAVGALAGGLWFGWHLLDPAVALLGATVIGKWSIGVLRDSAKALVDASSDPALVKRVRALIEGDGDAEIADLHVWQVGSSAYAAIVCVVADKPLPPADYKARLDAVSELRHVTVEVNQCPGPMKAGLPAAAPTLAAATHSTATSASAS